MSKKIRLVDIAELANVSVATVSIVLNHPETNRFPHDTKQKIIQIAQEHNYVPNIAAQELVGKSSKTIALIQPDIENPYFSKLAKILERILLKIDYTLIIVNSGDEVSQDIKLMDMLAHRNVAGILLAASISTFKNHKEINEAISLLNIPVILLDRSIPGFKGSQIVYDNKLGGLLATEHCIKVGHEKIGHISARASSLNGFYRYVGYKEALEKYGLPYNENFVYDGFFDFDSGYNAVEELLERNVTAIVAANDLIAYGAMKKINELGLIIPNDISIIGYDNNRFNDIFNVKLSSIEQDIEVLAKEALDIFFKMQKNSKYVERIVLTPELIERKSVYLTK